MVNILIILGAVLIIMYVILMLIMPIGGIIGAVLGAFSIWYGMSMKKKLASGQLSPKPVASPKKTSGEVIELRIAGTSFHQDELSALAKVLDLDPDSDVAAVSLDFVPEPTNEYDPNALKAIVTEDDREFFIGYCPKKDTDFVRKAIEANLTISGEITSDDGTYYASAFIL